MANTLPGCPIVGFYSKEKQDFEGHNQEIKVGDGNIEVKDTTIPYGFVDMNPKVWFQKFADGPNQEIHEYLMTEGYIWAGQFPEAKRILTKGNNQSMELDDRFVDGDWAEDDDGYYSFFIINDAVISKLCVLGEDVEPCFEGAQIKASFSLNDFNEKFKLMAKELKEILNEGGQDYMNEEKFEQQEEKFEEEFAEKKDKDEKKQETDSKKDEKEEKEEEDYKKKKGKCSLKNDDDIDYAKEYIALFKEHAALEEKFNELKAENEKMSENLEALKEFKLNSERKEKENMIDSFYMLSDEDKKDVRDNIDSYSLDDIEAKLAVICVRNKVNFNSEEDEKREQLNYNTNFSLNNNDGPEWLKAVDEHEKKEQF